MSVIDSEQDHTFEVSKRCLIKAIAGAISAATSGTGAMLLSSSAGFASVHSRAEDAQGYLNVEELVLLKSLCSLVIPSTDTPDAGAVGVHDFINKHLLICSDRRSRQSVSRVLGLVAVSVIRRHRKPFEEIVPESQLAIIEDLDEGAAEFSRRDKDDFRCLKKLICLGYYTSEVGAARELRYLPIPGGFEGSTAYAKTDASWSLTGE